MAVNMMEKKRYAINLSKTNGLKFGFRYVIKMERPGEIELEGFAKVFNPDDFRVIVMSKAKFYLVVEYIKDYCDIPVFKCHSVNESVLTGYALYNPVNKEGYGDFEIGSPHKFATIEDAVDNYMRGGKEWKSYKFTDEVVIVVLNNQELLKRCDDSDADNPVIRVVKKRNLESAPDIDIDFSSLFDDMF